MKEKGPRIRALPFEQMRPFEQRIRLLCREAGLGLPELGVSAGLSRETVPKWIVQNQSGADLPGTPRFRQALADRRRVPLSWLESPVTLSEGDKVPASDPVAPVLAPEPSVTMLSEALDAIVAHTGLRREKAWAYFLDLHPEKPSALGYFMAALARIEADAAFQKGKK